MRFFRGFAQQTRGKLAAVQAVIAQALVLRAQGKYDCELPTGGREDDARSGSAFVRHQLDFRDYNSYRPSDKCHICQKFVC